jgi:hypothetical protein
MIVAVILRWLQTVCLGLWMGGLIAIGAMAAPAAFHVARVNGALAGNKTAQDALAGGIVGEALRHFNTLTDFCAIGAIAAGLLLLLRAHGDSRLPRLCAFGAIAATAVAFLITLYCQASLFPAMDLARGQSNMALFDTLHHRYEGLAHVQFPILLAGLLLIAIRDTPRRERVESPQ